MIEHINHWRRVHKMNKQLRNFPKLMKVILSCETPEQCEVAMKYLSLYRLNYVDGDNILESIHSAIEGRMFMFLQDTAEHSKLDYHKSQVNNFKTTATWPDMNDYLGEYFDIKFRKTWSRNTSSVIV